MAPIQLSAASLLVLLELLYGFNCTEVNSTRTIWARYGSSVILDCEVSIMASPVSITWTWNKHQNRGSLLLSNFSGSSVNLSVDNNINKFDFFEILANGSLLISDIQRTHAGMYYCIAVNDGWNDTAVLALRLDYNVLSIATLKSIIIGLGCASAFFLLAVLIGLARYLAYVCSSKEKRKRKSIRAVLESIQDYKTAQFDRFSAYRSAKMGQLSAFKSSTMGHLSAFRDARVDQLRTYKQATITSILAHLERMREHYAGQTVRIKENCAMQAERLRDSYSSRRGRFKDYRSHHVDRMRENYQAQAVKIREYGQQQMNRLREQYKTQQQHVLKLVELLDVGSCVSGVIEAECMRAESMIFDADIAFDFEAQPARIAEAEQDLDREDDNLSNFSDTSRYVSACESVQSVNTFSGRAGKSRADVSDDLFDGENSMNDDFMFQDIDLGDFSAIDFEITRCIANLSETHKDAVEGRQKTPVEVIRGFEEEGAVGGAPPVFETPPTSKKSRHERRSNSTTKS